MTILYIKYVKRYTDNLTTRKIREGLGLGFTFPTWRTKIKNVQLRKSSGYFWLCDASLEQLLP